MLATIMAAGRSSRWSRRRVGALLLTAVWVAATVAITPPGAVLASPAPTPVALGGSGLAWGSDQYGQLGPRTNGVVPRPTVVPLPTGTSALALGRDFTVAVAGGRVYAWGRNDRGQLGDGTTVSRAVPKQVSLPPVAAVACDEHHVLAVTTDGRVYAWGGNTYGELGDGTTADQHRPTPVALPAGVRIVQIATGITHSLAVTSTGTVWSWGGNTDGELGTGTTSASSRPTPVRLPAGARVSAVAAGYRHSLALTTARTVLAWGGNDRGQLGLGSTADSLLPRVVSLPAGAAPTQVAAGALHSEVVRADGTVLAWGDNAYGELGDGTTTTRLRPVRVHFPAGFPVRRVSVGQYQSLALTGDSAKLFTWGSGEQGQLGDGHGIATTPLLLVLPGGPVHATAPRTFLDAQAGYYFDIVVTRLGTPAHLVATPASAIVSVGSGQDYRVEAYDAAGNDLGPASGVSAGITGGHCVRLTCTPTTAGAHPVSFVAGALRATAVLHAFSSAASSSSPAPPSSSPAPSHSASGGSGGGHHGQGGGGLPFTGVAIATLLALAALTLVVGLVLARAGRARHAGASTIDETPSRREDD